MDVGGAFASELFGTLWLAAQASSLSNLACSALSRADDNSELDILMESSDVCAA